MATGKCLKCDAIGPMTEDHLIPRWFIKVLPLFGIKVKPESNVQLVCQKCNGDKGGKIDFSSAATRDFIKQIMQIWVFEIEKHEPTLRL